MARRSSRFTTRCTTGTSTSLTTHCPIRTSPLPNAEYHTYKFEWFPNWINFYIDDKLLRTVTNPDSLPDPTRDQRLHLNIWGQATDIGPANGDWTGNPVGDPSLGPATSRRCAKTYFADFQAVSVDRLSSRLGTANADTLAGSAGNDGIDGARRRRHAERRGW